MSEWNIVELGACAEIKGGKRLPKGKMLSTFPTPHPYIRVTDLNNGRIELNNILFVEPDIQKHIKRYTVSKNDLILSIVGTIGLVAIVPRELHTANLTENCVKIHLTSKELNLEYLYHYLRSKVGQDEIDSLVVGSTQPKFPLYNIKKIKVPMAPIKEQEAIAEVLSSLDDKIDLLHRNNKTLEQLAETLFRQLFVEEAEESWESKKIGEVATINPESVNKKNRKGEIKYLDTGSITKGYITSFQTINYREAPSRAQRKVKERDILYSLVRPDQRHYGIMPDVPDNTIVSTGFCVIRSTQTCPYFLYLLLTNDETVERLHSIAEGSTSTYPSLRPEDIFSFQFQLPPTKIMSRFENIAEGCWKKIEKNQKQIKQLETLRDTLLPKLMSGVVRVQS